MESSRARNARVGGITSAGSNNFLPSWALHGLKWVAVFIVPLTALWIGQSHGTAPVLQRDAWIVSDLPRGTSAHLKYGNALRDLDRFDEAGEQYRIVLELDPNAADAHYGLGHVLLAQSKLNDAASQMEEALRKDPRNGEIHSDYGYVLEGLGRKDEAIAEYENAIRLNPKSGRVHYNYAMFLASGGKLDQAIGEFQAALKYKPNHPEAHYQLGKAFSMKGDLEGAKIHYQETARLDPKAPVHNSLGVIYMRLGQVSQAIAQFNEALRLHPDDAVAAENLRIALANERRARGASSTPR
ncbi:MAG: hypothetical protein DMF25_06065 [Verrucomicrobia bacterium]|nr:MAG: hypothetical protein DMF25_06065 [Verrucomicrobiota bacterium]